MKKTLAILSLLSTVLGPATAQTTPYDSPAAGNPIIPGYFADPTVKKFGDTYYLYSTTDGNGGGKGPSQVWVSQDFVNWTLMPMNWPTTLYYWAPDVMEQQGKYYLYYCQPCMVYCGEGETPRGPWTNILGDDEAVLIPDGYVKGAITLDGQSFTDDDGSTYLYWGTWGIYPDHGCGVGKLTIDKKAFELTDLIPNTQATDFFEAPFMIKKDSLYYFTYSSGSCHDDTYRVQYAVSSNGPMGPFTFADNNPLLATNADHTVDGPGHHSILHEGDKYYIVYHRHNLPGSTRGMHRQIAADELRFGDRPGIIEKVVPTHSGIGYLQPNSNPFENLAAGKKVRASSYYNNHFKPQFAVDDNNATLWRPATTGREWIEVDLGARERIRRVWTQFEYPTAFVRYIVEVSDDGEQWRTYSDRRDNLLSGSPMVEYGDDTARYLRLTFTGAEQNGTSAALWNIKVFGDYQNDPPQQLLHLPAAAFDRCGGSVANSLGMMAGSLSIESGSCTTAPCEGRLGVTLTAGSRLASQWQAPRNLYGEGRYTLAYSQYGDGDDLAACHIGWGNTQCDIAPKQLAGIAKGWHTLSVVSDGKWVRRYADGRLLSEEKCKKRKTTATAPFVIRCDRSVTLGGVRLYNWAQQQAEIEFDSQNEPQKLPAPAPARHGLIAALDADALIAGQSMSRLPNCAGEGSFESEGSPIEVVVRNGRNALAFNGSQQLRSTFALPSTLSGNAPYSVTARFINPQLEEQEVLADLNRAHGELERIAIGYGKDAAAGIANHNGSHEDMGLRHIEADSRWHHLAVSYDGYMEKIYLDGRLVASKDIVLRLPGGQPMSVGGSSSGDNRFSGYLNELSVYDVALTADEIKELCDRPAECTTLLELNAADIDESAQHWHNEGVTGGSAPLAAGSVGEAEGKIALLAPMQMSGGTPSQEAVQSLILRFAAARKKPLLMQSGGTTLAYDNRRHSLRIERGEESATLTLPRDKATATLTLVWLPMQGAAYLNGERFDVAPTLAPQATGEMATGENIVRLTLSSRPLAPGEAMRLHQEAEQNSVQGVTADVRPVTDQTLAYSAESGGQPTGGLSYRFSNRTTGWSSGWTQTPYAREWGLQSGKRYEVQVSVRDAQGNIAHPVKKSIAIDGSRFERYEDNFDSEADYRSTLPQGGAWQGVCGHRIQETTIAAQQGTLVLGSKEREFSAAADNNGPLLYRQIEGDFVMQVEIADFSGYRERKAVGLTEGGLMLMLDEPARGTRQQLMHQGTFPYWNVGNMLTDLTGQGRPQYFNKLGYDLHRHLQVERSGDLFFFRTSADGIHWEELPQSPLHRPHLRGKALKAGLYQMSYREEWGEVRFDNFRLWIPK